MTNFIDSAVGFFKSLFGGSPKTQAQPIATPQFSNFKSIQGWQNTGFTNNNSIAAANPIKDKTLWDLINHRYKKEKTMRDYIASQGISPEFNGLPIRFVSYNGPGNFYFGGAINTSLVRYNNYLKTGRDPKSETHQLLMHEYGHYLQEKLGGKLWFHAAVVPSSLFSEIFADDHRQSWTEIQASTMAYYYFGMPSYWDMKADPIDQSYISVEQMIRLYYRIGID